MTRHALFQRLCSLADTLQAECVRLDVSPHKLALEAIVERLDVLIDAVLEDGVQDDAPAHVPLALEQWRARERGEHPSQGGSWRLGVRWRAPGGDNA